MLSRFSSLLLGVLTACGPCVREPHGQSSVRQVTVSPAPMICWNGEPVAGCHWIEISRTPDFSELFLADTSPVSRYVPPNGLGVGKYYWRVRPADSEKFTHAGVLEVRHLGKIFEIPLGADAETIRDIFAMAVRDTPARVVFPEGGEFRLDPGRVLLNLEGVHDLVVDGRGTRITFTNPMSGFARVAGSSNIAFQDFVIDHDPPPFSVARVTEVDREAGRLRFVVLPGHPEFDAPHMLANWGFCTFLGRESGRSVLKGSKLVPFLERDSLRRIADGYEVVSRPEFLVQVNPGDRIVQYARNPGGQSLFHVERSSDMVFLRITNHSISGGHYLLLECDAARILGCHSTPREGLEYGGNADGAHIRGSIVGPWIEGCSFEAIGDDGVAIFAKGVAVLGGSSSSVLVLDEKFFNFSAGQEVMVWDPRKGEPVGESHVIQSVDHLAAAEGNPGRYRIKIFPPLKSPPVTSHPEAFQNDQVFNLSAWHGGFVVRRNFFRDVRRYGVIVRGKEGAIEDNQFVGISDSAITLQNEPNVWRNGPDSLGVRIAGNHIERCNFSESSRGRGALHVALYAIGNLSQRWDKQPSHWIGHRKLTISNNIISDWRGHGMVIANASCVLLRDNHIQRQLPQLSGFPPSAGILVQRSTGVVFEGNIFEELLEGTPEILDLCDSAHSE